MELSFVRRSALCHLLPGVSQGYLCNVQTRAGRYLTKFAGTGTLLHECDAWRRQTNFGYRRSAHTITDVAGANLDAAKLKELTAKMDKYPQMRMFKAIGLGDADFVTTTHVAAAAALGRDVASVPVSDRSSKDGKYVAVTVGPVQVESVTEVEAVYAAMKHDPRVKFLL